MALPVRSPEASGKRLGVDGRNKSGRDEKGAGALDGRSTDATESEPTFAATV